LDADEIATLAAVDIDRLKEERMRGPERTSGYELEELEPQRRSRGLWSNYTPSSQQGDPRATMSSGVTDGTRGVERDASALGSERETSVRPESESAGVLAPEIPSQRPTRSGSTQSKASRMALQPVAPGQPADELVAPWRAEALFDCEFLFSSFFNDFSGPSFCCAEDPGAADDPNELSLKKGEHLTIIDKSGKWWEAKTKDGRTGSTYPLFPLFRSARF